MTYEQTVRRVRCDKERCTSVLEMDADPVRVTLLPPWRNVLVEGWAGFFQACSDECEQWLRDRYRVPRRDGR